ncbi:Uncharacterized protein TCM_001887 isoform 1 [Theobroma cacao]|uniref:Uncharacterized protein isoform 1 n=1 Tax=Theobroma cacao TaxID=3641 RepID=A0A061DKR8_THECC|nr:Uncharacterized protein TCM_001887 isoform 1 [Theobroma cacao]
MRKDHQASIGCNVRTVPCFWENSTTQLLWKELEDIKHTCSAQLEQRAKTKTPAREQSSLGCKTNVQMPSTTRLAELDWTKPPNFDRYEWDCGSKQRWLLGRLR